MKLSTWILVCSLFLITAALILYKTLILGVSFIPTVETNLWNVELALKMRPSTRSRRIGFPVPRPSDRMIIKATQFDGKGMALTIDKRPDGLRGQWQGKVPAIKNVFYRVVVELKEKQYTLPSFIPPEPPDPRMREYLVLPELSASEIEAVKKIEDDILPENINRVRTVKAVYYFLYEEVLYNGLRPWKNLQEILDHMEADSQGKARLFTVLCRRQGVPARTVGGINLRPERREDERGRHNLFYWNEVYLDGRWIPVCATYGVFAALTDEYLPLFWNVEGVNDIINDEGTSLRVMANRVESTEFSLMEYRRELRKAKSWLLDYSLYLLPMNVQTIFRVLILIPFGAILLVLFRNIIGIRTFGIFMPVLLALFFRETSYFFGMAFFSAIVLAGLGERMLLKRLQLLAVPRMAVLLTLVVGFLCIFAVLNHSTRFFHEFTPALFPIIITTIFIERFSLMLEEEGLKNTMKALAGTVVIATITFWVFSIRTLQTIVFTHPETLLSVAAVLILVGKYTGYRLTELARFRELFKGER